jgi:GNAT superfamily N-acetyltransferase
MGTEVNFYFLHEWPIENTMAFEDIYPANLKLSLEEKLALKEQGAEFIYILDIKTGEVIGETYFIAVDDLKEVIPGLSDWKGKNAVYVYSTTILRSYQNKGIGKLLKSYFMKYIADKYSLILGHARENASVVINKGIGAEIIKQEQNWQGTGETYFFYKIAL